MWVKKNENEILLCILYLIHGSPVKLYNGDIGIIESRLIKEYFNNSGKWRFSLNAVVPLNGKNALWKFMSLEFDADKYIDDKMSLQTYMGDSPLGYLSLIRNQDGFLKLSWEILNS